MNNQESRDESQESLDARVERLERSVEHLRLMLERLSNTVAAQHREPSSNRATAKAVRKKVLPQDHVESPLEPALNESTGALSAKAAPAKKRASAPPKSNVERSEAWLKIIGIVLLLLGVGFLFKYSIDQGWITEWVRVGAGMLTGCVLFGVGLRVMNKRDGFSQVMFGGGIAAWYISGFAAFQMYSLVSHPIAFAFMVAVTLLAFFLSIRRGREILAVVGVVGGLSTPFLLYTGSGNVPGLVGYTMLLLGGVMAIYFFKRWHGLLWVGFLGVWAVLGLTEAQIEIGPRNELAIHWGIIITGVLFAFLPLIREVLSTKNPSRWLPTTEKTGLYLLTLLTPFFAITFSANLWRLNDAELGWLILGSSALFVLIGFAIKAVDFKDKRGYFITHLALAIAGLTFALLLLLEEGNLLFISLGLEALGILLLARGLNSPAIRLQGHVLFGAIILWLLQRIADNVVGDGINFTHADALANLMIIGLAVGGSFFLREKHFRVVYRVVSYVAFLGWLLAGFMPMSGGQGLTSIAWGISGVTLLVFGLRKSYSQFVMAGMGTLLLVVGKLFLVDLAELDVIWRILLFIGFGALFLFLSYYFRDMWKKEEQEIMNDEGRIMNDELRTDATQNQDF